MENREAIERALELLPQMRDSEWITAVGQVTAIYTDEAKEVFNTAISALEKQEIDRWIPCKERLPEPRIDVWCNSDLGQMVGYYDEIIETWYGRYGRNDLELLVTAWRPLPEPFREEE